MPNEMIAIPAFQDNYIWLYLNKKTHTGIVVDPGNGLPVLAAITARRIRLAAILITHHHADHTAGIDALCQGVPSPIPIYGPKQEHIPQLTHRLSDGETIAIPDFPSFEILGIPGHTAGHIAYYCADASLLFCGDTLFAGGCGRLFEGTPDTLLSSLHKINALPPATLIYCAHEYTEKNLAFALSIEAGNLALQQRYQTVRALRAKQQPTLPSTLYIEQQTNPFLRTQSPDIIAYVSQRLGRTDLSELDIFTALRSWKDFF